MITENTTIREFLQTLGTECLRNNLSKNIWAAALFADYKEEPTNVLKSKGYHLEDAYPNWCITDMRFPNEMEAVKERKGITIRVVRPDFIENALTGQKFPVKVHRNLHASETALDDAEFDYEIINDGSIEDLIEKVREILINEKLL
jgi:hypothetical protein